MRVLAALLFAFALTGCEDARTVREAGRFMGNVFRVAALLPPIPGDNPEPRRYDAPEGALEEPGETVPAGPSLLVTYGSQRKVFTLLQANGEQRLWRSADGTVMGTDGARVVATAGLSTWVAATRFDGPDPLAAPNTLLDQPAPARRLVDLMTSARDPDRMRFGVSLECRLRAARAEGALYVEERCGGGARFVNRFWADPNTGAVWRSEQWVGLDDRMMTVEVLTPPAT